MGALALLMESFEVEDKPGSASRENALARRAENLPAVETLPAHERLKRDERWLYCKLVVELGQQSGKGREECCMAVATTEAHRFPILTHSGQGGRSQLTYNNCRNWLRFLGSSKKAGQKIFHWDNKNALVDGYKRGKQEVYGDPVFWRLFDALYLQINCLSIRECYRRAAAKVRESNAFALIPKLHQVTYRVQQMDPRAVHLARRGEEWVKNHMIGYITRDWSEVRANEIWVADHRVFDFPVKVWNDELKCWEPKRPWVCLFLDAKSWHVISLQITAESPNNAVIRNGLGLGIHFFGLPDGIYMDNGKDFKAAGFSEPVKFGDHEHSILKSLGIRTITSLPYNGRAKLVERFFKYVSDRFDRQFAAYLGNKPAARPEVSTLYYKKENVELLPSIEEFSQEFYAWLDEYHNTPNDGRIMSGQTPRQAFAPEKRYKRPPRSRDELYFDFLMPLSALRTVHRGPAVSVNKVEYYGGEALWQHFGKKVMVKINSLEPEHIFAFEPDGRFICECRTRAAIKAFVSTDAERAELGEALADRRRDLKACSAAVYELTGGYHQLSPRQILCLEAGELEQAAKLRTVAKVRSVKGASHELRHSVPRRGDVTRLRSAGSCESGTEQEEYDFKEDREQAKLLEFQAGTKHHQEAEASSEDIADFHQFIVNRRQDDYE